ncbi:MAG: VOC family protein [Anaerolineae bacterium]|nr:VOC family protein [Anaerolineae bacterium]
MKLKATHHVAIFTQNFAAMEQFYTGTLGLKVTKRWDPRTIIFIDIGSTTIELIGRETAPGRLETGPIHHIALHVADVDSAHAELVARGVKIKSAPANFEDVRICFFFDPDGNSLELVEDPRRDE